MPSKAYFLSDAHLGSLAVPNNKENERLLVKWLESIQADCAALYLMGDMIDFWFEYATVVPKGFVRFFGKLAEFTDKGIPVHWFTGNHDIWLFEYVQNELGIQVSYGPKEIECFGKKLYLAHGDGLGDPSSTFKLLRSIFHNRTSQRLFRWIHPDVGLAFGLQWAKNSRLKRGPEPEQYLGEDKEFLVRFAKSDASLKGENAPDYYIFGHRHILLDLLINKRSRIVILGDWIEHFSYAVLDEKGLILTNLSDNNS